MVASRLPAQLSAWWQFRFVRIGWDSFWIRFVVLQVLQNLCDGGIELSVVALPPKIRVKLDFDFGEGSDILDNPFTTGRADHGVVGSGDASAVPKWKA